MTNTQSSNKSADTNAIVSIKNTDLAMLRKVRDKISEGSEGGLESFNNPQIKQLIRVLYPLDSDLEISRKHQVFTTYKEDELYLTALKLRRFWRL
jgi:hypothetical protein